MRNRDFKFKKEIEEKELKAFFSEIASSLDEEQTYKKFQSEKPLSPFVIGREREEIVEKLVNIFVLEIERLNAHLKSEHMNDSILISEKVLKLFEPDLAHRQQAWITNITSNLTSRTVGKSILFKLSTEYIKESNFKEDLNYSAFDLSLLARSYLHNIFTNIFIEDKYCITRIVQKFEINSDESRIHIGTLTLANSIDEHYNKYRTEFYSPEIIHKTTKSIQLHEKRLKISNSVNYRDIENILTYAAIETLIDYSFVTAIEEAFYRAVNFEMDFIMAQNRRLRIKSMKNWLGSSADEFLDRSGDVSDPTGFLKKVWEVIDERTEEEHRKNRKYIESIQKNDKIKSKELQIKQILNYKGYYGDGDGKTELIKGFGNRNGPVLWDERVFISVYHFLQFHSEDPNKFDTFKIGQIFNKISPDYSRPDVTVRMMNSGTERKFARYDFDFLEENFEIIRRYKLRK